VWLVRRPATGLLGGMVALPGSDWTEAQQALLSSNETVRHVFTHFSLDLAIVRRAEPIGEGWWHPIDQLADAGLPTLYRKVANAVLRACGPTSAAA
jgi:A/G-specific adenine glycosylase